MFTVSKYLMFAALLVVALISWVAYASRKNADQNVYEDGVDVYAPFYATQSSHSDDLHHIKPALDKEHKDEQHIDGGTHGDPHKPKTSTDTTKIQNNETVPDRKDFESNGNKH